MSSSKFPPRTVHLSSRYADAKYTPNDTNKCNFQLNTQVTVPPEYVLQVSVLSASIPQSYYNIPSLTILTFTNGAVSQPVNINPGNYSGTDIATIIDAQIPTYITVTFSNQTGKFTFTGTVANTSFVIPASPLLGTSVSHTINNAQTVYSDYIPDLAGTRYINIVSSLNTESLTAGTAPLGSGVLASIPASVPFGQFITYIPNNLVRNQLKESYISYFDISICDSDLNLLSLNNVNWEIVLLIEVVIPPGQSPIYNASPNGDLLNAVRTYHPRDYAKSQY